MCAHACEDTHICVYIPVEVNGWCPVSSFDLYLLYFLSQSLSLNIDLSDLLKMTGQLASGSFLSWLQGLELQMSAVAHGFYMEAELRASCLHSSGLFTRWASFQPFDIHFDVESDSCHIHIDHFYAFMEPHIIPWYYDKLLRKELLSQQSQGISGRRSIGSGNIPQPPWQVAHSVAAFHILLNQKDTLLQLEASIIFKTQSQWPTSSSKPLLARDPTTSPNSGDRRGLSAYLHRPVVDSLKPNCGNISIHILIRVTVNFEIFYAVSSQSEDMW